MTLRGGIGHGSATVLLAALLLTPGVARAQAVGPGKVPASEPGPAAADRARADALLKSGDTKLAAGDGNGALADYLAADSIVGTPMTRLAVGKAHAAMGLLLEARETLAGVKLLPAAATDPPAFKAARDEAVRRWTRAFQG
jgi:hypothetical protein